ncbi:Eco57I restriction-modification methylase domain-containing protein [Alphaproteobacteria bacterium]|nr:Eco57I restriction-modification methylase domain-containing protein [Alphaproteobacteria bacterium]
MLNPNYNPDVITCLANLSTDEVFTSPSLANKMLDVLPKKLFLSPETTFLDPGTKSGVFLREIAKRLDHGLREKIPNKKQRINHILTKQIFGIALTDLTGLLSRRSLYCSKTANGEFSICDEFTDKQGNIFFEFTEHEWSKDRCLICGANKEQYDRGPGYENHAYRFIHDKRSGVKNNMQFDVIIGNPPYHISDSGESTGASPIYQTFVERAIQLNPKYVCMIIPSRWFAGGKGLDKFRNFMLSSKKLSHLVDYPITADVFPGLKVIGGVCYFLWDRDHSGPCEVSTKMQNIEDSATRDLDQFDIFVRFNKGVSILEKVLKISKQNSFQMLNEVVSTQKPFGLRTFEKPSGKGDILLFANKSQGFIERAKITKNNHLIPKWKVLLSMGYGEGGETRPYPRKITGTPIVAAPQSACTETYLVVNSFDREDYAVNFASFLRTRFARFLIGLRKNTQHITSDRFAFVPSLPMNEQWSEEKLFKFFKITSEELDFVNLLIRPMDDENG